MGYGKNTSNVVYNIEEVFRRTADVRCGSGYHRSDHRAAAFDRAGAGFGGRSGTGYLHGDCSWICDFIFRGSQVQIAGPTAAFATIVAGIVAKSGVEGLAVATIMAGIILIIMGFCHFGSLIKFIPFTITTGFTSGMRGDDRHRSVEGFLWRNLSGRHGDDRDDAEAESVRSWIRSVNLHAIIVGVVCLAILIVMPMITEKIPGSLVAVIAGILMVKFLPLHVNTIGDLYTVSNKLPAFRLPVFSYDVIQGSLSDAFTIAVLAAIESLLSCV